MGRHKNHVNDDDFEEMTAVDIGTSKTAVRKDGEVCMLNTGDFFYKGKPFYNPKADVKANASVFVVLKKRLPAKSLEAFRSSCFGYFFYLNEVKVQVVLLNLLLQREIKSDETHSLWFKVDEKILRFGLEDFGMVTGLKVVGDSAYPDYSSKENQLIKKYFKDVVVTRDSLEQCLLNNNWRKNVVDGFKIGILYFLSSFLFSYLEGKAVPEYIIDIVDSGDFDEYPWGKLVFEATVLSLHNKFAMLPNFIRHDGSFPLALQVWFYECCKGLPSEIATRVGSNEQLILNWTTAKKVPRFVNLYFGVFSMQRDMFKNLSPTSAEKSKALESKILASSTCSPLLSQNFGFSQGGDGILTSQLKQFKEEILSGVKKEIESLKSHFDEKLGLILEVMKCRSVEKDFQEAKVDQSQEIVCDCSRNDAAPSKVGSVCKENKDSEVAGLKGKDKVKVVSVETKSKKVSVNAESKKLTVDTQKVNGDSDWDFTTSQLEMIDFITGQQQANPAGPYHPSAAAGALAAHSVHTRKRAAIQKAPDS